MRDSDVRKQKPKSSSTQVRRKKKPGQPRRPAGGTTLVPGDAERLTSIAEIRRRLGVTQRILARMLSITERSLIALEAGKPLSEAVQRRLTEIDRLRAALAEVIEPAAIGPWLQQPNPAFDNRRPVDLIEQGEIDRLWEMIFFLRSGVAS